MNITILKELKKLKDIYKDNGFLIVGVFGSYARDEENKNSDIDILYKLDKKFIEKYGGWGSIMQLDKIKEHIKYTLNINKVDLATSDTQNKTLQNILKNELVYV